MQFAREKCEWHIYTNGMNISTPCKSFMNPFISFLSHFNLIPLFCTSTFISCICRVQDKDEHLDDNTRQLCLQVTLKSSLYHRKYNHSLT